jgi:hypothetical protein
LPAERVGNLGNDADGGDDGGRKFEAAQRFPAAKLLETSLQGFSFSALTVLLADELLDRNAGSPR